MDLATRIWDELYDMGAQDCPTVNEIQYGLTNVVGCAYLLEPLTEMMLGDTDNKDIRDIVFELIHHMESGNVKE